MIRATQVPVACRSVACTLSLALAWGACAASQAQPTAVSPASFTSLAQVVFALLVVLGAIGLFAWLMRRFVPGQAGAGGLLKVVGGVMVGPRERLVVVEVGDTWLLLGVAATSVNLVHTMPKPAGAQAAGAERRAFARLLGQVLKAKRQDG